MSAENWKLAAMAINDFNIKLMRPNWKSGLKYIRFSSNQWVDNCSGLYEPDFSTGTWEIYEEPKKKKKVYIFALKERNTDPWRRSKYYYESEEELMNFFNSDPADVMRLDDTMIEVDE